MRPTATISLPGSIAILSYETRTCVGRIVAKRWQAGQLVCIAPQYPLFLNQVKSEDMGRMRFYGVGGTTCRRTISSLAGGFAF